MDYPKRPDLFPDMAERWITEALKKPIPGEWQLAETRLDGFMYVNRKRRLSVIISGSREEDGKKWIHLSIAHPERLPKWQELIELRDSFLGNKTLCLQVLPPKSRHVNIHKFCLHLWHCVDGDPIPDFTRGHGSI